MVAQCWAHVLAVAVVVQNGPGVPDPLGTCFECSVFGCAGHAEKDQGSGKWICFTSVAKAVAASAGVGEPVAGLELSSSQEFEGRFPALADATVELRAAARIRLARHGITAGVRDTQLLADAVGVAHALVPEDHEPGPLVETLISAGRLGRYEAATRRTGTLRYLFPGQFGELLSELET
jgi:hypothetical protein